MKREVLEKRKRILGDEHPDTIGAMNNLAITLGDLGQLEEAIALLEVAAPQIRRIFGDEHPHTRLVVNNLARFSSAISVKHNREAIDGIGGRIKREGRFFIEYREAS
jgi:Tetratricopeptide repeat